MLQPPLNKATLPTLEKNVNLTTPLQQTLTSPSPQDTIKCLNYFLRFLSQSVFMIEFEDKSIDFKKKIFTILFDCFVIYIASPIFKINFNKIDYIYNENIDILKLPENDVFKSNYCDLLHRDENTRKWCCVVIVKWIIWQIYVDFKMKKNILIDDPFLTINNTNINESNNQSKGSLYSIFSNKMNDFINDSLNSFKKNLFSNEISSLVSFCVFNNQTTLSFLCESIRFSFTYSLNEEILTYLSLLVINVWLSGNYLTEIFINDNLNQNFVNFNYERFKCILISILCSFFDKKDLHHEKQIFLEYSKVSLRIIRIFIASHENKLHLNTWNFLLDILNNLSLNTFPKSIKSLIPDEFSSIYSYLLDTFFITWIRANCIELISNDRWNTFFTFFKIWNSKLEVFKAWSNSCNILTRILCQTLYKIDLNDLPLERVKERRFGKKQTSGKGKGHEKNTNHCMNVSTLSRAFMTQFQNIQEEIKNQEIVVKEENTDNVFNSTTISDHVLSEGGLLNENSNKLLETSLKTNSNKETIKICENSSVTSAINSESSTTINSISALIPELENITENDRLASIYEEIDQNKNNKVRKNVKSEVFFDINDPQNELKIKKAKKECIESLNCNQNLSNQEELYKLNTCFSQCQENYISQLWCNFMLVVGPLEDIQNSSCRLHVITTYYKIWKSLYSVYCNQGISDDNKYTPKMPNMIPPLFYFTTIILKYLKTYDSKYKECYLMALKFLLDMTICEYPYISLEDDHIIHFIDIFIINIKHSDPDIVKELLLHSHSLLLYEIHCTSLLIPYIIKILNTYFSSDSYQQVIYKKIILLIV